MAELVDASDSKSDSARSAGSIPARGTSSVRFFGDDLQIVESRREGAAVRRQVIAALGRIDELQQSGKLDRLLRSGACSFVALVLKKELEDRLDITKSGM